MKLVETVWGVRCVWLRYLDVFRKSLAYYLVTTLCEPFLYLLAFGFGVGGLIGTLHVNGLEVSYRRFVFVGILGQTVLFQGFYEASYGGFVRMYYQRIFQAMAVTPITLSEVPWGELLWDASKATLAAAIIASVGVATGDFPPYAPLAVIPVAFPASLLFAGLGLAVAARSRTIEEISYPQYLPAGVSDVPVLRRVLPGRAATRRAAVARVGAAADRGEFASAYANARFSLPAVVTCDSRGLAARAGRLQRARDAGKAGQVDLALARPIFSFTRPGIGGVAGIAHRSGLPGGARRLRKPSQKDPAERVIAPQAVLFPLGDILTALDK